MGIPDATRDQLAVKCGVLFPHLDERQRRLLMGVDARILGHGGVRVIAQAAQVSETTVRRGVDELEAGEGPLGRVRRPGGGRKKAAEVDPGLRPALLALVEPDMRGVHGLLARLFGVIGSTLTRAGQEARPLLAKHDHAIHPSTARFRTPTDVAAHLDQYGTHSPMKIKPAC